MSMRPGPKPTPGITVGMMNLPDRMRTAADTLEELSALYGYRHPGEAGWSANELRHEITQVENGIPHISAWGQHPLSDANCSGHVYTGDDT